MSPSRPALRKTTLWTMAALLFGAAAVAGESPADLPEAQGYETIYRLNPLTWKDKGYVVDRGDALEGDLKRVAYFLRLMDKDDKESWVFVSMKAFTDTPALLAVPAPESPVFQQPVEDLEVLAGGVDGLKTGRFEAGNIEIWGRDYGPKNAKNVPGAREDKYDFGDTVAKGGNYTSVQVHNTAEKQTVFAFNSPQRGGKCDLGIGNNPDEKGQPDWTFSNAGQNFKNADLWILGQFENLREREVVRLDPQKVNFVGKTDRDAVSYAPGDEITFTLDVDFGGVTPTLDYFVKWTRAGDDGEIERGREKITGEPIVVKTTLAAPGFVRLTAAIVDKHGRTPQRDIGGGKKRALRFDGGAGVSPEKLEAGAPEPADFDAFWTRQKERLAQVPLKHEMEKLPQSNDKTEVYAVKIDCAGPRPVTGYLAIPANAAPGSLKATVSFIGYGTGKQKPPGAGERKNIAFTVNAHGYELGRDDAYYKEFANSIKSNGKSYAFDPKQNSDPEQAYFNHMALRVMRALEFVKSLPAWNGRDLEASGGSQGGLQTVWAAALDPDVTSASANVPWCCDLGGKKFAKRLFGGWHIEWVDALGYYDAVNHAKRVKCPLTIPRAGLGDYTCPPSGVAVLYNNLAGPKRIFWVQDSDHGYTPQKPERFERKENWE